MDRLFEGLAWSAFGFMIGFCLCWLLLRPANKNAKEASHMPRSSWWNTDKAQSVIGVVILIMLFVTGASYYHTSSCQTDYNQAVASSLNERSVYSGQQSMAQADLLQATLSDDPLKIQSATREYLTVLDQLEKVRAANPIPTAPDCSGF